SRHGQDRRVRINDVLPNDAAGVYIRGSAGSSAWYLYTRRALIRGDTHPDFTWRGPIPGTLWAAGRDS
ncbi:MAG: hypothetical protein M0R18_10150, partial [Deltaproteobacteria bacterium]|nr:hypothetical protein [Deltaproteobacteria bacterium]